MSIRIAGTGSYAPEKILTNFDLEKMVETSDEWIRTRTGIEQRHIGAPEQATSDFAFEASKKALEAAGITAQDLDAIIVATVTPDHAFPSTACLLQKKLGAREILCFDIEAACSGLLFSLEVGHSLMVANRKYRHVLVLGAEKLSSITNWQDRNTCVLFGDGSGAVVLEQNEDDEPNTILASDLHANGAYGDLLKIATGGSRCPNTPETLAAGTQYIHMEGRDVFKLAVNGMVGSSKKVLEMAGVESKDLKLVVPHQANYRIIDAIAQRLDVQDGAVYVNINRYGNTSAASIGICLDEIVRGNKVQRGDYVLLTAFGGGLTWGALLLRY